MDSVAPGVRPGAPAGPALEEIVLEVIKHPRYRGHYMPVWRILDAIAQPLKPAAVRRALERLEGQGRVERHRATAQQIQWRVQRR